MLYGGPAHIKLVAEWEPETKAGVFGVVPDDVPEPHESASELRQYYQQPLEVTLHDCLQIYTQEETVSLDTIFSNMSSRLPADIDTCIHTGIFDTIFSNMSRQSHAQLCILGRSSELMRYCHFTEVKLVCLLKPHVHYA